MKMLQKDTFICVYGILTHVSGFMENQFQILNLQIFHSFQIIFIHLQNHIHQIDILHETEQGGYMLQQVNTDQQHIHDTIITIITRNSDQNCYFVDGPDSAG